MALGDPVILPQGTANQTLGILGQIIKGVDDSTIGMMNAANDARRTNMLAQQSNLDRDARLRVARAELNQNAQIQNQQAGLQANQQGIQMADLNSAQAGRAAQTEQMQLQNQGMRQQMQANDAMAQAYMNGDSETYGKLLQAYKPDVYAKMQESQFAMQKSILEATKVQNETESVQLNNAAKRIATIAPMAKNLIRSGNFTEGYKNAYDTIKQFDPNAPEPGSEKVQDYLMGASLANPASVKPMSGDGAKLAMNASMAITAIHEMETYFDTNKNDSGLAQTKWQPNIMAKDAKYQKLNGMASMLQSAVENLLTGASVSPEQAKTYAQFQPKVGDTFETLRYKMNSLRPLMSGTLRSMGADPTQFGVEESWLYNPGDKRESITSPQMATPASSGNPYSDIPKIGR